MHHYCKDEKITPVPDPVLEGYIFLGWSEIPEYMPDHDVIVTGNIMSSEFTDGDSYTNDMMIDPIKQNGHPALSKMPTNYKQSVFRSRCRTDPYPLRSRRAHHPS